MPTMQRDPDPSALARPDARAPESASAPGLVWSLVVFAIYIILILAALYSVRTPGMIAAGSELSIPRSVFTVANAISLTGFEQTVPVESYKPFGQVIILILIVAASLISMIIGAAAVARIIGLPYSMGRIILSAIVVEALAIVIGAALLIGGGRNLFEACFQAASAFGNCGITIGPAPGANDALVHAIVLPLAVVGGLGLPVLMELYDAIAERRKLSTQTRTVLVATAVIFLVGTIILMGLSWPRKLPEGSTWVLQLKSSFIQSATITLNSRTLGWGLESPAGWARSAVWIVMILMFIGAGPAGTGGGLKSTAAVELGRGIFSALRGTGVSRTFGFAALWLMIYSFVILLTVLRLVVTEPQVPSDQILFIAISAVSNTGMAFAPISITGDGLHCLAAAMLLGRILPWLMLWWAALTLRDARVAVA